MKYVSKRQRKRQFSAESDENSSESGKQMKVSRKPKVKQSQKKPHPNPAVAATRANHYKNPIIAPATTTDNRRYSSSTSSSGSGGSGSGSSTSTMNRYTSGSWSSNCSGSVEHRPSIYHYQNAQTLTLASFIEPGGLYKPNPGGKSSKSSKKPTITKGGTSTAPKKKKTPLKSPPSIDPEEDPEDTPLISSPQPTRTSVLLLDLGPLMIDLDELDLPEDYPFPAWRNPLDLSPLAPPTEPEQTDESRRPLNPIGYEIMMRGRMRSMLEQEYNDRVAKLVAMVESIRFLWDGIVAGKEIWKYNPEELVSQAKNEENKSRDNIPNNIPNVPNSPAKRQNKLVRNHFHGHGYGFPVVCVPGYWIYPMQPGYWPQQPPQQSLKWWDNMGYVNALAQMDLFLVNLSPMEIHAAQMYAMYGEAFFKMPLGKCYSEEEAGAPPGLQYYPPPTGHHQMNGGGGGANKSHPKRNQAEQQPMRKSGSGEDGSRPGGSGSVSGSKNGREGEVGSACKASSGAQGSSKDGISEDHKYGVDKQRNHKNGWCIVDCDSDDESGCECFCSPSAKKC